MRMMAFGAFAVGIVVATAYGVHYGVSSKPAELLPLSLNSSSSCGTHPASRNTMCDAAARHPAESSRRADEHFVSFRDECWLFAGPAIHRADVDLSFGRGPNGEPPYMIDPLRAAPEEEEQLE